MSLDVRRMGLSIEIWRSREPMIAHALSEMQALEAGAVANPDEGRRVGHYWLRAPSLAPEPVITDEIEACLKRIRDFLQVHEDSYRQVLLIGIGGSALGPQLVIDALGLASRPVAFIDNTDPDGISRVLQGLTLETTLVLVISKSGGTPETRNGYQLARAEFERQGVSMSPRAVAITGVGSTLDQIAIDDGWLARFPMWDWVGGRTSVTSAVGLLPAGLAGVDVDGFIEGARVMDEATRTVACSGNPAAMLALAWYEATEGCARRAMVVLPYKDRLCLLARYLQQLIMESIGKRYDLEGHEVCQGLAVYGNKGSTDQHAYVQQLRDGPDDHFVTFIEVLEDGGPGVAVSEGVTAGDYLSGFLAGTRSALTEVGRRSLTITLDRVDARSLGALVALFERAVGLYATLVGINAYHQPGVEAGKKAAVSVLELQARLVAALGQGATGTATQLATATQANADDVFHILRHLAANGRVRVEGVGLDRVFSAIS